MKLSLSILSKFISLPVSDPKEIRKILDDIGLEVKDILVKPYDTEFNIETLANRGDHLSAFGVARELSARFLLPLKNPELSDEFEGLPESINITVNTSLCPIIFLMESQINAEVRLSKEISDCLADNLHPELPLVDICEYLNLELGHPVHAFDLDKIKGQFRVEQLSEPARITGLDNKEYSVPAGAIVGRDDEKICVVSGVIGCANSMIDQNTKRILVEAAVFDPVSIRKTARAMGVSTGASYAFERGVDCKMPEIALRRFLILAKLKAAAISYFKSAEPEERLISLSLKSLQEQLALEKLDRDEVTARFRSLGYQFLSEDSENIILKVPSWRLWDVEKAEDLTEDFARSRSLSSILRKLPEFDYNITEDSNQEKTVRASREILHGLGFSEVITKNLYSAEELKLLGQLSAGIAESHISIKNSIEKNYSNLKITNIIHMGRLLVNNIKRGRKSFKVYENSRLFCKNLPQSYPYQYEYDVLSIAFAGRNKISEFRKAESVEESFYWFKGVLESLFSRLAVTIHISKSDEPFLHPGRQAKILVNSHQIGFFGQVHPVIQQGLDLNQAFMYAQIDLFLLENLISARSSKSLFVSDFPAIDRDLTLKVSLNKMASEVLDICMLIKPANLQSLFIVDEFRKPQEDFRRVSYRYVFQNEGRTLSAEEVDQEMKKIMEKLQQSGYDLAI